MNPNDLSSYKSVFVKSSNDHIAKLEEDLNTLRTDQLTRALIDDIYLHLHSIKGECNVMDLESIAQKCEASLEFLRQEKDKMTTSKNVLEAIEENFSSIKSDLLKFAGDESN